MGITNMERLILTKGSQSIQVDFEGDDIKVELLSGFPPGMPADRVVDTVMQEFALKDKIGHKPHIHTKAGRVIYTG